MEPPVELLFVRQRLDARGHCFEFRSTSSEAVDSLLEFRSSHFAVFNSRLNCGERRRMVLKSSKTSSAVPPSVPSSRYHTFRGDDKDLVRAMIAGLNRAGPKGSPC